MENYFKQIISSTRNECSLATAHNLNSERTRTCRRRLTRARGCTTPKCPHLYRILHNFNCEQKANFVPLQLWRNHKTDQISSRSVSDLRYFKLKNKNKRNICSSPNDYEYEYLLHNDWWDDIRMILDWIMKLYIPNNYNCQDYVTSFDLSLKKLHYRNYELIKICII